MSLCVSLFVGCFVLLFVFLFVCLFFVCLFVCFFVSLFVCLFVCLLVCLNAFFSAISKPIGIPFVQGGSSLILFAKKLARHREKFRGNFFCLKVARFFVMPDCLKKAIIAKPLYQRIHNTMDLGLVYPCAIFFFEFLSFEIK